MFLERHIDPANQTNLWEQDGAAHTSKMTLSPFLFILEGKGCILLFELFYYCGMAKLSGKMSTKDADY